MRARSPDRPTLKMTEGEASGRGGARGGGGGGGTGTVCPVINAEEYFYCMFSNSFVFYNHDSTIAENRFLKLVKPDKGLVMIKGWKVLQHSVRPFRRQRKPALCFPFLSGLEEHCCDPSLGLARINKYRELKIDLL